MKRLKAYLLLKGVPQVRDVIKWIFDPETRAKKRTLIVFLLSIAGGMHASTGLYEFVCHDVDKLYCAIPMDRLAHSLEAFANLIGTPEMGGVAFITGMYAIFSGFKRDKK